MTELIIEQREDTPFVNFNPEKNIFVIKNKSLPENAIAFYEPILIWIDSYINEPLEETYFNMSFEYFNTASAKQIGKLLVRIQKLSKVSKTQINWHYEPDDIGMLHAGKRFAKLTGLNFNYVESKIEYGE